MDTASNRPKQASVTVWCRVLLCAAYLLAGATPLAIGVVRPGITGYEKSLLEDMVYGQAYRPFVKRQLVPLIVRAGVTVMPDSVGGVLRGAFASSSLVHNLGWPPMYASEFVLTLVLMYASMVGFMVLLQRLLKGCLAISTGVTHAVVLSVAVGLPLSYAGQVYVYDYTQLLLFTGGLLCMMKDRWVLYYPVLAVACLNKETSILLPFVFACWKGKAFLRRANLLHFLAQVVIAASICGALAWLYRQNPGGNTEWHLGRNLAMQFSLLAWLRLTILALGIVLALYGMRTAPTFASRAFLVTVLALLPATFLFGYIDELRDYYEALPCGVVLVTAAVQDIAMRRQGTYIT